MLAVSVLVACQQPPSRLGEACAIVKVEAQSSSWRASALAGRLDMFRRIQRATSPFNLTGVAHNRAEPDAAAIAARLAARYGPRSRPMLVVGDSISREVAASLDHLLPGGSDHDALRIHSFESSAVSFGFHSSTNLARDWSAEREQHYMREAHWFETNISHVLSRLDACEVDAVFVGGYGNWQLRRGFRRVSSDRKASPTRAYERFVRDEMALASCLAHETALPVVFVGTIPVHAPTVLLDPPKADWADQYDLALTELYPAIEREVFFAQHQQRERSYHEHEEQSAEQGNARTRTHDEAARLHYLSTATLVDECPLARCDGVHFGSDFPSLGCRPSMILWHRFLARFLQSSGILDVAPATRYQSCQARRRHRQRQHDQEVSPSAGSSGSGSGARADLNRKRSQGWRLLETCARRWIRDISTERAARNPTPNASTMRYV
jgi:hypothetical protein